MKLRDGFNGERSIVIPKILLDKMSSDPVLSTLYITDIGYYPHAAHHYRERKEPINQFVLIYCVSGCGWVESKGVHLDIEADSYVILPAGEPHRYGASDHNPWTIYWLHFSGSLARFYVSDAGSVHTVTPGNDSRIRNRTNLFEEIFQVLETDFGNEGMRYAMSLLHHYLGSLRYKWQYRRAESHSNEADIINSMIHFMNENLEKSMTLNDLAEYAGLSASYMSVQFRERTGHSPMNYFNLLKIKHACHLLDETDMKINTICHKVGVQDPYYFSRLFSKIMGMSPREYRGRSSGQ